MHSSKQTHTAAQKNALHRETSPPTPPGRLCNELAHTWLASWKVENNQTKNVNKIIVSVHSADAEPVTILKWHKRGPVSNH